MKARLARDVSYGGITVPKGTFVKVLKGPRPGYDECVIEHAGARVTVRADAVEVTNWRVMVSLARREIVEILNALADVRDSFGEPAGDLEVRLTRVLHEGDAKLPAGGS